MTDPSPAHEFIAYLGQKIADEEIKVRQRIYHLKRHPDAEEEIREEWHRFRMAVEPMRRQRDYVIKQLATVEAMKIPGPIIIMNPPARS